MDIDVGIDMDVDVDVDIDVDVGIDVDVAADGDVGIDMDVDVDIDIDVRCGCRKLELLGATLTSCRKELPYSEASTEESHCLQCDLLEKLEKACLNTWVQPCLKLFHLRIFLIRKHKIFNFA